MVRRELIAILAIAALAAGLLAGCGGGSDSESSSTASADLSKCNIDGKQQDLGASYVTTIEVSGASCSQAEKVVTAYHQCRQKNGGAGGTCDTPVQGFDCSEAPRQSVPGVQFNATMDCKQGDTEIKSTYTQNF